MRQESTQIHPDTRKVNSLQLALAIAEARIRAMQAEIDELRGQVKP